MYASASGSSTRNGSVNASCTGLTLHTQYLARLCRICGKIIVKGSRSHSCHGYMDIINSALEINLQNDQAEIQPASMCQDCYCQVVINRQYKRENVKQWAEHPRVGRCEICQYVSNSLKGGRPHKKVKVNVAQNLPKPKAKPCLQEKPQSTSIQLPIDTDMFSITCKKCGSTVPQKNLAQHTCTYSKLTFHDHTYTSHLTNGLTQTEKEAIANSIVKEKLVESGDGATIILKGKFTSQDICTRRVSLPRKPSSQTTSKTRSNREKSMKDVYRLVHMEEEEEQVLEKEKECKLYLDSQDINDLKSMMGMSWRKLRKLKSWLLERNVSTAGEKAVRILQRDIIQGNLQGAFLPLQHWDESRCSVKMTPYISISNLEEKVMNLLEEYRDLKELNFYEGRMEEVWVKIGGDKGGDTFKLMLQVANLHHPNSLRATHIIGLFPGKDTPYNLDITLSALVDQIDALQNASWRGRPIRCFFFGDYEYLCRTYGLSGPSGRHCCLYCTATKAEMALPLSSRGRQQERTLETLKDSLALYRSLNIAKEANNVIRPPQFNIPINQVCPPGLHFSLGIFLKHFKSLECSCHELDLKAASLPLATSNSQLETAAQKHRLVREIQEKEEERKDILDQHMYLSIMYPDSQPADLLLETAEEKRKEISKLEEQVKKVPDLKVGEGPITQALDDALKGFSVQRQAFHGKSFVGNHVHKSLNETNINKITDAVVRKTSEVCPALRDDALAISVKYNTLFKLYAQCDNLFNRGNFLTSDEIHMLDNAIKEYLHFFRSNFPTESITPKMHILEDHTVPWFERWGAGLALMGEQGGEGMHAHLNKIRDNLRCYSLTDDLQLHLRSVEEQWIYSNPASYHRNKKVK